MTAPTTARYVSRYRALRIVSKPSYTKEVDGRSIPVLGRSIVFEDNQYVTSDPEEIAFLDARPEIQTGIIVKVPDNIADPTAVVDDMKKTLEDKEAEIARLRAQLGKQEIKEEVEVAPAAGSTGVSKYSAFTKAQLIEECKKRGLPANRGDALAKLVEKLETDDSLKTDTVADTGTQEGAEADAPAF